MAYLSSTDLFSLDYNYQGLPFAEVTAGTSPDLTFNGLPFNGPPIAFQTINVFIKIAGEWKGVRSLYYNNNNTWKPITSISKKIEGVWVD